MVKRALAAVIGLAAIASVAFNIHPVFVEEPPELWREMHNVRHAVDGAGDQVCLPTADIRGVERFASRRYVAEWRSRFGLMGLGLLAGALAAVTLVKRDAS